MVRIDNEGIGRSLRDRARVEVASMAMRICRAGFTSKLKRGFSVSLIIYGFDFGYTVVHIAQAHAFITILHPIQSKALVHIAQAHAFITILHPIQSKAGQERSATNGRRNGMSHAQGKGMPRGEKRVMTTARLRVCSHPQGELADAKRRILELEARNAKLENELKQHALATKVKGSSSQFTLPDPNKNPRLAVVGNWFYDGCWRCCRGWLVVVVVPLSS